MGALGGEEQAAQRERRLPLNGREVVGEGGAGDTLAVVQSGWVEALNCATGPGTSCCAAVRAVLGAESAALGAEASDAGCCFVCSSCLQSVQSARAGASRVNAHGQRRNLQRRETSA
jgi:hypothetical protein